MYKLLLSAALLAASLLTASVGHALEKTAMPFKGGDHRDEWATGTQTCTVSYFNYCTGWAWIWYNLPPGDRVGVAFSDCGGACTLGASDMFFWQGALSGYGLTGTIAVYASDDNECPTGPPLASQALLPVTGWNIASWDTPVPNDFVIVYEFANATWPWRPAPVTDHPSAGPTGPQACGTCYPTSRVNHTFLYGSAGSPLCPGSAMSEGVCDSQVLANAYMSCSVPVESRSWAGIKAQYR